MYKITVDPSSDKRFTFVANAVDATCCVMHIDDASITFANIIFVNTLTSNIESVVAPIDQINIVENPKQQLMTLSGSKRKCVLCGTMHVIENFRENCARVKRLKYDCIATWKKNIKYMLLAVPQSSILNVINDMIKYMNDKYDVHIDHLQDMPVQTILRIDWQKKIVSVVELILNTIEQCAKNMYIESLMAGMTFLKDAKVRNNIDRQCKNTIEIGFMQFRTYILHALTEFVESLLCNLSPHTTA